MRNGTNDMSQDPSPQTRLPTTARLLGWSGLLPFCALPLLMLIAPGYSAWAGTLLAHYAFGILCFLLGIWWGIGVMRGEPAVLVYSNALCVNRHTGRVERTLYPFRDRRGLYLSLIHI